MEFWNNGFLFQYSNTPLSKVYLSLKNILSLTTIFKKTIMHNTLVLQETHTPPAISHEEIFLTEKAASQVTKIKQENSIPENHFLRLGIKGGGCSGFSYVIAFDDNQSEKDVMLEQHGVKILVDPKSLFYLGGTMLDYQDGLMGKGFVFNNPNATKTCGCGNSFSA
jgi:iron-sulfur cluster assembly protein